MFALVVNSSLAFNQDFASLKYRSCYESRLSRFGLQRMLCATAESNQLTSDQGDDEGAPPGVEGVPLEALLAPPEVRLHPGAGGCAALAHAHLTEGQPHVEAARRTWLSES